jgi:hypothetical protein
MRENPHASVQERLKQRFGQLVPAKGFLDLRMGKDIACGADAQAGKALVTDAVRFALVNNRHSACFESVGDGGRLAVIERIRGGSRYEI